MSLPRRAFAAHPDALADLRNLPEPIRDQALLHLQDLVNGERVAKRLQGRLEGFHKVILGVGTDWASHRLVVQFRPAPATSKHEREVYLVAAGPARTTRSTAPPSTAPAEPRRHCRTRRRRPASALPGPAPPRREPCRRLFDLPGRVQHQHIGHRPEDHPMTADRTALSRTELADLLTGAACSVSALVSAEYPTPAARSYLHPVLGVLSAGPAVVSELNDRLEDVLAEAWPDTPAGLFALASYAAALGWLTESLAELTDTVDHICIQVGIPAGPPDPDLASLLPREDSTARAGFGFSVLELAAVRAAAETADLTSTCAFSRCHCWPRPGSPTPAWRSPAASPRTRHTCWVTPTATCASAKAPTVCRRWCAPC
ncbi:hypothetical protein VSR01_22415 [Actinacidiphila sp. DG2A-62]|uniref:hypothetical protein n=1 Tax=Actinacidiphila sp. DG2A-62 TaxID=3108821 RepID=UPI002DB5EC66|nr:hypothetical protein [Actinacidiphila sp. DG2A-62]MEC3996120.1 hypothetical protein [Actinacidiphila sp. DG2A-62]